MTILYFLLAATTIYVSYCLMIAIYVLYEILTTTRYPQDRPDFLPLPDGATVKSPKTPALGGNMAAAAIIDGSAVSQTP